jgi:hypothetical protein
VGARFGLQSYLNSKDASGNHYAQLACCDGGLTNFFPGLASDLHLLDLFLLSSYDYRHEPLSWPISIYLYMCVCVCVCVCLYICKAGTLQLEPQLWFILLWLFWRWGLEKYLSGLALNHNFPGLSLPSS